MPFACLYASAGGGAPACSRAACAPDRKVAFAHLRFSAATARRRGVAFACCPCSRRARPFVRSPPALHCPSACPAGLPASANRAACACPLPRVCGGWRARLLARACLLPRVPALACARRGVAFALCPRLGGVVCPFTARACSRAPACPALSARLPVPHAHALCPRKSPEAASPLRGFLFLFICAAPSAPDAGKRRAANGPFADLRMRSRTARRSQPARTRAATAHSMRTRSENGAFSRGAAGESGTPIGMIVRGVSPSGMPRIRRTFSALS